MTGLDAFDPATWHVGGVVRAGKPAKRSPSRRLHRFESASPILVAALLTASIGISMNIIEMPVTATAVSRTACVSQKADTDHVDPNSWGRLVTLFRRIPAGDEAPEPDDIEPLY